jgi:hypothetical protein
MNPEVRLFNVPPRDMMTMRPECPRNHGTAKGWECLENGRHKLVEFVGVLGEGRHGGALLGSDDGIGSIFKLNLFEHRIARLY